MLNNYIYVYYAKALLNKAIFIKYLKIWFQHQMYYDNKVFSFKVCFI